MGLPNATFWCRLEAGVAVLYVAGLLSHSSPSITQNIYQHVRRDQSKATTIA